MGLPPPTPKQAKIIWASLTAVGIAVLVSLLGLLVWVTGIVLNVLSPVLWPLAIAGIMAYLLDPVVDWFERRKVPRRRAIVLVFVIFVVLVIAGMGNLVPRLVYESRALIDRMPAYTAQMQKDVSEWMARKPLLVSWRERLFGKAPDGALPAPTQVGGVTNQPSGPVVASPEQALATDISEGFFKWVRQAAPVAGRWLLAQAGRITHWFEMVLGLALVPIFIFYFLLEKQGIEAGWTRYLPLQESWIKEELVFVLKAINNYLIVFFRAQVVIALCDGVMLSIGFLAMGLNFAVLIGLLAGLLGIIPYLGTVLTIVPAVILAAVQFQDWLHPLLVIGIYSLVHVIEGFILAPKIQGDRVGLHPLTIIVALLVGTTLLGGILGGILAIPLTAALRVVMFRYVWRKPEETARAGAGARVATETS